MFAKFKQVAVVGAAVAGVGWASVVSPAVAHTQPGIPQGGATINCPDIAGINYVPDHGNSDAYYLCVDGLQQQHYQCPPVTKLIMSMPPKCITQGYHGKP